MVVAKEISLEDVRLGLEKMPDRFLEHPATVLVITNLNYSEAPRLMPRDIQSAAALNWHEVRLKGQTSTRVRRADRGTRDDARIRLADEAEPEDRAIPSMSVRRCSWSTARTTSSCSTA